MSTVIDTAAAFGSVGAQLGLVALVVLAVQAVRIGRDLLGYRGEGPGAEVVDLPAVVDVDAELMALAERVREQRTGPAPRRLDLRPDLRLARS